MTVTDNNGAPNTDTVQVTVNANPNTPPVVTNTGGNPSITLPVDSVSLTATATDDGTIQSYSWSKVVGPSTYSIVSPGSLNTVVRNLGVGSYQFQLSVIDNGGAVTSKIVFVTVSPNITPVISS